MRTPSLWRLSLFWALTLLLGESSAQPLLLARPSNPCEAVIPTSDAPRYLWDRALGQKARCQSDVTYLVAVARWLNQQRRFEESELYSERALLVSPTSVPALIEFAIGRAGLGDPEAGIAALIEAKRLVATELPVDDPSIQDDSVHRAQSKKLVTEIEGLLDREGSTKARPASSTWEAFAGYDDNFLRLSSLTQIDLSMPSGLVTVDLSDRFAIAKGVFAGISLKRSGEFSDSSTWNYDFEISSKQLIKDDKSSLTTIKLGNWYLYSKDSARYLRGSLGLTYLDNGLAQARLRGAYGLGTAIVGSCRVSLGAELQFMHYPLEPVLDGTYSGVKMGGECAGGWSWQTNVGQDRPRRAGQRAGGAQSQLELVVSKHWSSYDNIIITLNGSYWLYFDQNGYSPLLSNYAKRRTHGMTVKFEVVWNRSKETKPYVAVTASGQDSNIPMFGIRSNVIQFGLKKSL